MEFVKVDRGKEIRGAGAFGAVSGRVTRLLSVIAEARMGGGMRIGKNVVTCGRGQERGTVCRGAYGMGFAGDAKV